MRRNWSCENQANECSRWGENKGGGAVSSEAVQWEELRGLLELMEGWCDEECDMRVKRQRLANVTMLRG